MNDGLPRLGADRPQTLADRADATGEIWEARQEARGQVAERFETIDDPADVPVRRRDDGGFAPGRSFLDRAEPREAAARLDDRFPRQDLGPGGVRETDEGYVPTERVERRSVAREAEATTPVDDVDPFEDVRRREGGGFGLGMGIQREIAAERLDPEYPEVDLGRGDVERDDGQFGLTPDAEREVGAERIEEETPLEEVDPREDVRRTDDGFELRDRVIEENRGLFE
ncbi:MAG: hypothetical protein ACOC9N_01115 [Gemmatimonadota bacterium]